MAEILNQEWNTFGDKKLSASYKATRLQGAEQDGCQLLEEPSLLFVYFAPE